jgi:hypothetical protein
MENMALVIPDIALTLRYEHMRIAEIDIHELSRGPADPKGKSILVIIGKLRNAERGARDRSPVVSKLRDGSSPRSST